MSVCPSETFNEKHDFPGIYGKINVSNFISLAKKSVCLLCLEERLTSEGKIIKRSAVILRLRMLIPGKVRYNLESATTL